MNREEGIAYVSEFTPLVDSEATASFQVYLKEGESAELAFLYAANPGFDEMVITYDLQVRGAGARPVHHDV